MIDRRGTSYPIEFVADKVPVIDSTWDAIHTSYAYPQELSCCCGLREFDPSVRIAALLLATAGSHKAATRQIYRPNQPNSVESFGRHGRNRLIDSTSVSSGCIDCDRHALSLRDGSGYFQDYSHRTKLLEGSVRQMILNVLFHQSHWPDGDPVPPRIFSGSVTNVNSLTWSRAKSSRFRHSIMRNAFLHQHERASPCRMELARKRPYQIRRRRCHSRPASGGRHG